MRVVSKFWLKGWLLAVALHCCGGAFAQSNSKAWATLHKQFTNPPPAASPWVFWYWYHGEVSKQGITTDLEAMKANGIGGAYLMPIKDTAGGPGYVPPVRQLTPGWWQMVAFAMQEADRLGLQLGVHVSDGFALAGGPWITPELSMQKLTWSAATITGGSQISMKLQQPITNEDYYRDIAVYAYQTPYQQQVTTRTVQPVVTASTNDTGLARLTDPNNTRNFGTNNECWIQYAFDQPFTCRSITIYSKTNYQANRLLVQASNDGQHFTDIAQLETPRHGWQDWDAPHTHALPATTAQFFRFVYKKDGTEPGVEDLDAAKWKPSLKLTGIELSNQPVIHQYQAKNGEVWRVAGATTSKQVTAADCIPMAAMQNISKYVDAAGHLQWKAPPGNWTILRIGHTSTGHKNETAGGGKGLECDKFNPQAVTHQFNNWFGQMYRQVDSSLAARVVKVFHVDSWECGSQNWSPVFRMEFTKRRGYDPLPYLPIAAGVPMVSVARAEAFLLDMRQTIAELVADNFYGTLAPMAKARGCTFTAESVAPTMVSDGMLHYQQVDVPMGEFWLNSPTHDKPNDMLDAISGAHVYGKNIVQAEAFTSLRLMWNEHPATLKTLQDRNYALGINRLTYHVFMHNPANQQPGMTLDGIGLYFQPGQTWWKLGKAWVDYARRCQTLLQLGRPVADIAVFTGEEVPRRAVLPDRLVSSLPGLFGAEKVAAEQTRLANAAQPLRTRPVGVSHSANMADPEDWTNPLNGYAYDSFNPDALLRLATVRNGRITLPGGASYGLLVLPGATKMNPANRLSTSSMQRLQQLLQQGAKVLVADDQFTLHSTGRLNSKGAVSIPRSGKHTTGWLKGPWTSPDLTAIGIAPDVVVTDDKGQAAVQVAWTHRAAPGLDIYFISNQVEQERTLNLSLRVTGRLPEIWNPVDGSQRSANSWRVSNGRTVFPLKLPANGSLFVVLKEPATKTSAINGNNWVNYQAQQVINKPWSVTFDAAKHGPAGPVVFNQLTDWKDHSDSAIRYYSGTAIYRNTFLMEDDVAGKHHSIDLGKVANLATVWVNGMDCGTVWTPPYRVDISKAVRKGNNDVMVGVVNTWANRMVGDQRLPAEKRLTATNAPYRLDGTLQPSGLLGPVVVEQLR